MSSLKLDPAGFVINWLIGSRPVVQDTYLRIRIRKKYIWIRNSGLSNMNDHNFQFLRIFLQVFS
jgi:hypothetical protein